MGPSLRADPSTARQIGEMVELRVKRLDPRAVVPFYVYAGDAGADLVVIEDVTVEPGQTVDIPTGWAIEPATGTYVRITGRSSTLRKRNLLVNEGIIDNGYRGPLFVCVKNLNGHPVQVKAGDRLAQIIVEWIVRPQVVEVEDLSDSDRGTNGFGSSGLEAALSGA